jgi:phage-related baseplate assembly protein
MTRFFAKRLDISRLASRKPDLILDLDYEAILAARIARLKQLHPELTAIDLETSAMRILQEEDAYRQLVDLNLLNTTVRGLLPLLSTGVNLDHIAARAAIERLQIGTDDTGNPIMEDDETFRMRYFASFGAPAAGSDDAYVFAALSTYPTAQHIYCLGPDEHGQPGMVEVVVTAPGGVAVDPARLLEVSRACNADNTRPLTDTVSVLGAEVLPYQIEVTATILPGPDPLAVKADIEAALAKIAIERYRGGGEVPRYVIAAPAANAGAVTVTVQKPVADIVRDPYKAPFCTAITVNVVERLHD